MGNAVRDKMQLLVMFVLSIYMSVILFSHYVLSCGKFFHLLRPDFWLLLINSINSWTTRLNYKSELYHCLLLFPTK